ncbi:MAG: hypothetical protein GY906_28800, partial [bacterium]|nr:hypothetical protein [bacterium]
TEYLVDPELNDWIESVPAKAQALLSSQSLSPPQDKTQMVPLHARSFMKSVTGSPYGIAASVLLVITVGLGGGLLHQFQRAEDAGQLLHQTRVQLAEARGEVEDAGLIPNDDVVRQLQELEGRHVAERQELRDQIKVLATQLEDAGVEKPLLNLPLVWLSPMETVRGDSRRVNLQGTAGSFLLVLEVQDARFFSTYRVDVEDIATGTITWSGEDLIRSGPAEIVLVLPRNLFPTGEYRLVLNGVSDSGEERLDQYSLQVNREEKNS